MVLILVPGDGRGRNRRHGNFLLVVLVSPGCV